MRRPRLLAVLGGLALLASSFGVVSFGAVAVAQTVNDGRIDVVQVNGLIDPSNAALIRSTLRDAERVHSSAVVFQLDASGAVDVDVNALLHDFTHATVPVTVWVGPSGGGVRGAAALLARSADFAAVASGAHRAKRDPGQYANAAVEDPTSLQKSAATSGSRCASRRVRSTSTSSVSRRRSRTRSMLRGLRISSSLRGSH